MFLQDHKYKNIEIELLRRILTEGNKVNDTIELMNVSFELYNNGAYNNGRSNYDYAKEFFKWMMTGNTDLSNKIKEMNPHAQKFVDSTNLPENFSSSYGWKIKNQIPTIVEELKRNPDSRRAYINILLNSDKIILGKETTHEFPCTIGIQFLLRNGNTELVCIVNMRSNNVWGVLPYDIYNFTRLQEYLAKELGVLQGQYYHHVNSLHVYERDVEKIKDYLRRFNVNFY